MKIPPDQAAQEVDEERKLFKLWEEIGKHETPWLVFRAALLSLIYQETLAVIGEDDLPEIGLEREWKNGLRAMQRQAAAKRYGQEEQA